MFLCTRIFNTCHVVHVADFNGLHGKLTVSLGLIEEFIFIRFFSLDKLYMRRMKTLSRTTLYWRISDFPVRLSHKVTVSRDSSQTVEIKGKSCIICYAP